MPRPRKCRLVSDQPRTDYFKPRGVPLHATDEVTLPVEGLEALRLADLEGLEQEEAARRMEVSRPTFSRILAQARQVVSQALVRGIALRIEGGDYRLAEEGRGGRRRGRGGRGGGRGRGMGPGGWDERGRGQGRMAAMQDQLPGVSSSDETSD
jgi:predicted DNA-binding protein (UPF0251 family)